MARTLPDPFQRPLDRLATEMVLSFGLFELVDLFSPCFSTFVDIKGGLYASKRIALCPGWDPER